MQVKVMPDLHVNKANGFISIHLLLELLAAQLLELTIYFFLSIIIINLNNISKL